MADLGFRQLRCQPHQFWLGLLEHLIELGAYLAIRVAGLLGRQGGRQLLLHFLQQLSVLGQHLLAVPLVQVAQFIAHPLSLRRR